MRIHELAKELNISSKELLAQCATLHIEAKSHMASIAEADVSRLRESLATDKTPVPSAPTSPKSDAPPAREERIEKTPSLTTTDQAQRVSPPSPPIKPHEKEPTPRTKAPSPPKPGATITIKGPIIVKDFAARLGLKPNRLIAELMSMNIFASINQKVDLKIAQKIAEKHGFKLDHEKKTGEHKAPVKTPLAPEEPEEDKPEDLLPRPPVITFLGHVDHGKTSLLDYIRRTRVTEKESGGITQHIGAYTIAFEGQHITFIDTPGHAAFTAMRARGANLTDIAVIIIAADEGVKPQTREAIQHAQAAGVVVMVALNKIDLETANPDKVKQELQELNLSPEEWGGDTICCPVSAKTGEGVDHLLEMILLQAEVLELKANPKRNARGYVIEAQLEPGMGPTAHFLVTRGTLRVGDHLVCGPYAGKVKALINDQGKKVRSAAPSFAVKCLGLKDVPGAGSPFQVYESERAAQAISNKLLEEKRTQALTSPQRKPSLRELLSQTDPSTVKELSVVLKADVQGSLEAIQQSLSEIKSDKVTLKIVLADIGNITGNDVLLASASNAIIMGFHVAKEGQVNSLAKQEGVDIRLYSIIYELLDDVRQVMTGLLDLTLKETVIGQARIKQVFQIGKRNQIAGCYVSEGRVTAKAQARLIRDNDVIYEGQISSLKRFQNDAREVRQGQECGLRLDTFSDYNEGDTIIFYTVDKIEQTL